MMSRQEKPLDDDQLPSCAHECENRAGESDGANDQDSVRYNSGFVRYLISPFTMTRPLVQVFDRFQKARREFVQTIAEQASRPENISNLMDADMLSLLSPLLLDNVPPIQQTAALAIGRLANYKESIAYEVVKADILPEIVNGIRSSDHFYQRNACFVIRTISKHSAELAQYCVDAAVLDPLVKCLESFDSKVREASAWALGFISMHSTPLAQAVVDANAIIFLISAAQDPELSLRRIAVYALGDICKHTPELAQAVIDARAIPTIAPLLAHVDPSLKQEVCSTLAQIAKHSLDSAELVANADIFPHVLECLKDKESGVRVSAAALIREIVKHTPELAGKVVEKGGVASLVQFLSPGAGNEPINAVMAIGFIASFSPELAGKLIEEGAHSSVRQVFATSRRAHVKSASAWALGQLGKHSAEQASKLTSLGVLSLLLEAHGDRFADADLKEKTKRALTFIIEKCTEIDALQPLIEPAQDAVQEAVLEQISKLLPKNPKARVPFFTSGGFRSVQNIRAEPGTKIREYIDAINECFPEHAAKFCAPTAEEAILQEIQSFDA
jgi:HEAT repeat protein